MTLRHKVNAETPLDLLMTSGHIFLMEKFGDRLAEAREDMGREWTQVRLADAFGKDQSTIAKWEKSTRTPRDVLENGLKYAEILHVNPVWLILGLGIKEGSTEVSKNIRYFQMLEALPQKDKNAIFHMIETLYGDRGPISSGQM